MLIVSVGAVRGHFYGYAVTQPIARVKLFVNCCHIFRMADVEFYVNADSEPIAEAQGGLFALKAFFLLIIPESCAL
jgi:hypothetical protein